MMRFATRFGLAAVLFLSAGSARADVIFSDNFDQEATALNYNSFANWNVTGGTVDTVGNGFFDFLPGNGVYVDLDGTSFDAGVLGSNGQALAPGAYTLSFDLAGSQRGDVNVVTVSVGTSGNPSQFGSAILTRASADPFTTETLDFVLIAPTNDFLISFSNAGGDNIGALLDRVVLQSVPEPSSMALCGVAGLAGLVARMRRRKSVA